MWGTMEALNAPSNMLPNYLDWMEGPGKSTLEQDFGSLDSVKAKWNVKKLRDGSAAGLLGSGQTCVHLRVL